MWNKVRVIMWNKIREGIHLLLFRKESKEFMFMTSERTKHMEAFTMHQVTISKYLNIQSHQM